MYFPACHAWLPKGIIPLNPHPQKTYDDWYIPMIFYDIPIEYQYIPISYAIYQQSLIIHL